MPELPEVETKKRYLERTSMGKPIDKVSVKDPRVLDGITPAGLARGLKGTRLVGARRRAKYILAYTDSDATLLLHFGMTGDLYFRGRGEPRPRFSRVEFNFEGGGCLHFLDTRLFGKVALYRTADESQIPYVARLGPEPLDRSFKYEDFNRIVRGHRTTIHQLLMDQELIAGIGNIYSDEITYQAGVLPYRRTETLSDEEVRALYDRMKWVLRRAVDLDAELDGHADVFLIPNRVKGGECPRTGEPLLKKTIAGRTSYYCPSCQH
jgi:formamidopyrimidine-DNA glycosylase